MVGLYIGAIWVRRKMPFIITQEDVRFSQMVFALMQDVAAQGMGLKIATVRKIIFERREARSKQTSCSL